MNRFDADIIHFLNQFAQKSWVADHFISAIADNELLTGGFIMSLFWWAWLRDDDERPKNRSVILSSIFLSAVALFLARALALLLPFRERPFRNPELQFHLPIGSSGILYGWSSFPSDHAVLFFALSTSVFSLSRRLGTITLCYSFFIACLPRIYMGEHYPTDILAGALLGVGIACIAQVRGIRNLLSSVPMRWFERSPETFYPCFFLITFLFGTMFEPLRPIVIAAGLAGRHIVHHT